MIIKGMTDSEVIHQAEQMLRLNNTIEPGEIDKLLAAYKLCATELYEAYQMLDANSASNANYD